MKLQMSNLRLFSLTEATFFASRLALGFVLFISAIPHLDNPYQFAQSVANYQILPGFLVSVAAVFIPVVQLVIAFAMLFVSSWRNSAAKWACAISALFLFVQAQALARGLNISCGCFGTGLDDEIGGKSLLQAAAVGVLGWVCLCCLKRLGLCNENQKC